MTNSANVTTRGKNKKRISYLQIGNKPNAKVLKELEIEEVPFQLRYTKGMTATFDLPNPKYKSPIDF
ncbi:hypothetical protein [Chengkuizengella sediminis]|uniref:hypothetical protein n=1 Tax=Chengkuizengella sediminis TaxID=1885917 RepID=UPI001389ECF5|nr:hypothetical protein [Chengkuizengella sediminis]NDI33850.1 hypothetical protein [Chengkuizengella sediminis]